MSICVLRQQSKFYKRICIIHNKSLKDRQRFIHNNSDSANNLQIRTLADSLYKVGNNRFRENKTSENVYNHFMDPTKVIDDISEKDYSECLKDFHEIHEATVNFGRKKNNFDS